MNLKFIVPVALRALGAASLVGVGAGCQMLLSSPRPSIKIKSWNFKDRGRIVDINPTSGLWTRVNEYQDKTLFNKCIRTTKLLILSSEECYDYIKTKASEGHPIKLFESEEKVSRNMKGWDIYRFIYGDGEETKYGVCMPIDIEGPNNPCSTRNLPRGWTKTKVSRIPVDPQ